MPRVAVCLFIALLKMRVFCAKPVEFRSGDFGHALFHGAKAFFHSDNGIVHAFELAQDGCALFRYVRLFKIAHPEALLQAPGAAVFLFLAGKDAKKGGFSAAVDADETHALPVLEGHIDVFEHRVPGESLAEGTDFQNDHAYRPYSDCVNEKKG